jgi:phospholipase/lecithinase/hemolysin
MRITLRRLAAVTVAAALAPLSAGAATMTADHLVVFGDSLSDTGGAHKLTGGRIPASPPNAPKRFSNGDIWVDHVRRDFARAGGTVQNYSLGGATSLGVTTGQVGAFALDGRRRPNMAAVLASVHNDLEIIARERRSGTIGRRVADAATRMVARSVGLNARALADLGISKFVVFNAVDIGQLPLYANDPRRAGYATRASEIFNAALLPVLRNLRRDGYEVVEFDIAGLFSDAMANPAAYGFTNVTDTCLRPDGRICADPDSYLYWDRRHPTAAAHRHIAMLMGEHLRPAGAVQQVQIAAAPIPAPAVLLLAALAGLGLAARRRAASA